MKNKRTYYQLILDRSGSMASCIEQTVAGVNGQIRRIRELAARFPDQELYTSLTLFNTEVSKPFARIRPEELRDLSFMDYHPDGWTALLDAIGFSLRDLVDTIGEEVGRDEASVVVVIITDGYENSSRVFTHPQIACMIHELEQTGRWTFSYLGATLDAVDIAESLSIKRENSISFSISDMAYTSQKLADRLEDYVADKEKGKIRRDYLKDEDTE